jgi:hypothetical protein
MADIDRLVTEITEEIMAKRVVVDAKTLREQAERWLAKAYEAETEALKCRNKVKHYENLAARAEAGERITLRGV